VRAMRQDGMAHAGEDRRVEERMTARRRSGAPPRACDASRARRDHHARFHASARTPAQHIPSTRSTSSRTP
jgi:hypothetical protein